MSQVAPQSGTQPTEQENFDFWIRMATDNKITSTNSWNFALIDYFHDLTVLKEGNSINFQKASATLDGCVKIYSSRVDSIATETGKLLSGLTVNKLNEKQNEENDSESDEDPIENTQGGDDRNENRPKAKKRNTAAVNTLVEFSKLQTKSIDTELTVDPLFKKALTDFDEGGAKSLLLNILKIDRDCRIVFDTSSERTIQTNEETQPLDMNSNDSIENKEIDVNLLRRFLPDNLDKLHLCPSAPEIEKVLDEGAAPTTLLQRIEEDNAPDENEDNCFSGPLMDMDDNFNEIPTIVHNNITSKYSLFSGNEESGPNITLNRLFDENFVSRTVDSEDTSNVHEHNVLDHFDNMLRKTWMGPQNFKIAQLQLRHERTPQPVNTGIPTEDSNDLHGTVKRRKNEFTIDFSTEDDIEDIFESSDNLLMPKSNWFSETHNLLPDDKNFTTKRMIHLFTKSDKVINSALFPKKKKMQQRSYEDEYQPADEEYFASKYAEAKNNRVKNLIQDDLKEIQESFDDQYVGSPHGDRQYQEGENFDNEPDDYADNNFNDMDEAAEDDFNPSNLSYSKKGGFGSQLVTSVGRFRPSSINFAKVSKRVDVKLLKDNLWETLTWAKSNIFQKPSQPSQPSQENDDPDDEEERVISEAENEPTHSELKFTDVVKQMTQKYSNEEKNEISTSFCFICLLHLANENGLTIENSGDQSDLIIKN
ncbi:Condensin complex subunit [Komagataella phaffii CBS 7435]|uniref:Condensin complex subunit 2 n=2 Tax=Komagataella phaffii TaxID=460519 RepID=C4R0G4_KOMPG|nr:Essential protein required for chromosome condensation [Komagataella phaffii GS115]AOA62083.1 GQ67_00406T0 [Komagataella phaffii]CAH2448495.1 Condensin complex subunit [Komagataella phaffii CBS 7435]AOA67200.1 GQ68_00983T0 [Komagataella phaffii GS115]CAY68988.1 Essential protein required for chromosome condensation [Komagataella phaffii GS115]CCA38614.1 Condensin complex subunit [Komagataella phaffii CBS 7435]